MKSYTFILLSSLLTLSTSIHAHEFWLEAEPFYQKTDYTTDISVHVGQNMKGDLIPNIPGWYEHFDAITAEGLQSVSGELGDDPAGHFLHDTAGVYAIGYLSKATEVRLDPKKFNTYLAKQGLEKIIERRAELSESEKNGVEIFYRNVKTLLKRGESMDVSFHQYDFGHPLNINPMQNPYLLKKGDALTVQITFRGKPAANLLLNAQVKDKQDFHFSVRTDEQGYATIPLSENGIWLLHTVEMAKSTTEGIDWDSFWGSLTFEMR